jgi:CHASE1-domain containing sensor protein
MDEQDEPEQLAMTRDLFSMVYDATQAALQEQATEETWERFRRASEALRGQVWAQEWMRITKGHADDRP